MHAFWETFAQLRLAWCARGLEHRGQDVKAAVPTLMVFIASPGRAEHGMRKHNLRGSSPRKKLYGDFRFRAIGMQLRTVRRALGPQPAKDDLLGRLYLTVDALSPVRLAFPRIADLHLVVPAGANILLVMDDRVRGLILTHPLF